MKIKIIFFFIIFYLSVPFSFSQSFDWKLTPDTVYKGAELKNLKISITNNMSDTLVFLKLPFKFIGYNCYDCLIPWVPSYHLGAPNIIYCYRLEKSWQFFGDGEYKIRFNHFPDMFSLYPKQMITLNIELSDSICKYLNNDDFELIPLIPYCFLNTIYIINNCNDSLKNRFLEKISNSDIISLLSLTSNDNKSNYDEYYYNSNPDENVNRLMKEMFEYRGR